MIVTAAYYTDYIFIHTNDNDQNTMIHEPADDGYIMGGRAYVRRQGRAQHLNPDRQDLEDTHS
jgi:hypothetical protein